LWNVVDREDSAVEAGPHAARGLAAYAADAGRSRGRAFAEAACPMRTPFQRDRDRIVHATAFRRLTYKTQVFLLHEGDHFRTRLTHTLEVSQIARSMARLLQLDEDLAEALALAHDLGHPPFGHAGERALNEVMGAYGGFDHNAQSFKVVTALERKYAAFDGLNLTFETLEGLAKHNGPLAPAGTSPGHHDVLRAAIAQVGLTEALGLDLYASAEAQVAAIADDIAYNNHDIDDGLRAGLIDIEELADVPFVGGFVRALGGAASEIDRGRMIYEVNRRLITVMIEDVVTESRAQLARMDVRSADDVRHAGEAVVAFSDERRGEVKGLRAFLFRTVYRHPRVMHEMGNAERIVRELFARYMADASSLPGWRSGAFAGMTDNARAGRIADFIAGMTDRYAMAEHRRLFDATPDLR
jgi:dGTPase